MLWSGLSLFFLWFLVNLSLLVTVPKPSTSIYITANFMSKSFFSYHSKDPCICLWTCQPEFKFWMGRFVFHVVLMPSQKTWIYHFSQVWIICTTYGNRSIRSNSDFLCGRLSAELFLFRRVTLFPLNVLYIHNTFNCMYTYTNICRNIVNNNDNFNERTNTLLIKIWSLVILLSHGYLLPLFFC